MHNCSKGGHPCLQNCDVIGLSSSTAIQYCSHVSPVAVTEVTTKRVEVAVLKPLWQLYTSMLKKYGTPCDLLVYHVTIMWSPDDDSQQGNTLIPEIIRALTELFLLVENIAEEWGVAQDHLIDMLTTEGLNTWLEKVGL